MILYIEVKPLLYETLLHIYTVQNLGKVAKTCLEISIRQARVEGMKLNKRHTKCIINWL